MRISLPRVIALELWDLPVAGKLLQEWRDDETFGARVAEAIAAVCRAEPAITHVHVTGGAVTAATLAAIATSCEATPHAMPTPPCEMTLPDAADVRARSIAQLAEASRSNLAIAVSSCADPYAAARAGSTLHAGAACVDVGQTAVKVAHGGATWRRERDSIAAPMRDAVPLDQRAAARATTLRWLAGVLAEVPSEHVVLALPCELVDGVPRSCTYCWRDPDPELVPELAGRSGKTLSILNDAELAAVAAAPHVPTNATTLVVTIGFAVGAALLLPSPP